MMLLVGRKEGHTACKKQCGCLCGERCRLAYGPEWWGAGVVVCLEQGADLHMTQLMPLPLNVSCFSKIQIDFIFLVLAQLDSPGKRAIKRVRACVRSCVFVV